MHLVMRSPSANLLDIDTPEVQVPTTDGLVGIKDHHAPLVAVLAPGKLRYKAGDTWKELDSQSGVLEMRDNQLLMLVEE